MRRNTKRTRRAAHPAANELIIDPEREFDLSPYLYMQFMEPLGTTDGSVEAAWDHSRARWRPDLVKATKELAPTLIRWGGILSSFYRWREGVGLRAKRPPMYNWCWGGWESNQVGTHEFVDLCRQVGAEPLMAVNFESDGAKWPRKPEFGGSRWAGPREAAEWVDYCSNPQNLERRKNGAKGPLNVRLWQIGNETSYNPKGFTVEQAAKRTRAFAKAMRKADSGIQLIGWGDSGWAPRMSEVAGEYLDYIAFHHHFIYGPGSPLSGTNYRKDPAATWEHFTNAHKSLEKRIGEMRGEVAGSGLSLAMTEGHFALRGSNRGYALSTWAAGVANARMLNVQARNGDILKIATLADFCGNRWQVNAIMMHTPGYMSGAYLMPVARVMSLFGRHTGKKAVGVKQTPRDLDLTASRTGKRLFLHVANTNRTKAVQVKLRVSGIKIASGRVLEIAADPMTEIDETCPDIFDPTERKLPRSAVWTFPAASVSAVEFTVEAAR
jgi:alpha-N-arabinofuranosidase